MSPESFNIRFQSLLQVQIPQQQRSFTHPFIRHFTGSKGRSGGGGGGASEKKTGPVKTKKRKESRASQYPFRNLEKVARGMLTLSSPSKSSTTTASPSSSKNLDTTSSMASHFELPKLHPINISLTDGTDIPPPDSPIRDISPALNQTQPFIEDENSLPIDQHSNTIRPSSSQDEDDDDDDDDDETTYEKVSPCHITKQPSSIRRFLSRRKLNGNFMNDSNETFNLPRPGSALSFISAHTSISNGKKRNYNWFGRISGGVIKKQNCNNNMVVIKEKVPITSSPPPPVLPQFKQFGTIVLDAGEGLGGAELFKNIS